MYTVTNYKTKKDLKDDVARGAVVETFQPGPFPATRDGNISLEGPHFPAAHRWYATAIVKDGVIVPGSVK